MVYMGYRDILLPSPQAKYEKQTKGGEMLRELILLLLTLGFILLLVY